MPRSLSAGGPWRAGQRGLVFELALAAVPFGLADDALHLAGAGETEGAGNQFGLGGGDRCAVLVLARDAVAAGGFGRHSFSCSAVVGRVPESWV
ncbi:hypothetical protein [Nocardia transvalensis]|uniref:hypothetical protein n=1 Tax=Nocardia transvalensis TaxID=37333 RepID=UPI001894781F|nr:hypothetical protein [Nocardia transvalensis]MBF6328761.1 hypothetical protein [Nocardia transvalensis]